MNRALFSALSAYSPSVECLFRRKNDKQTIIIDANLTE
jgi:hypothetical protein